MTPADLAYCVGIFEGEGCAGVYHIHPSRGGAYWVARISVGMDDPEPVRFLHIALGGNYCVGHSQSEKRRGRPPRFRWSVSSQQALRVARLLLPVCKSKRKAAQCQKIIEHYSPALVQDRNQDRIAKILTTYRRKAVAS